MEDEYHFLFVCSPLEQVRDLSYDKVVENKENFKAMPDGAKVQFLMQVVGMKETGDFLVDMFERRKEVLYKPNLG